MSANQSPFLRDQIAILSRGLEFGLCDDLILKKVFAELELAPDTLLPHATPELTTTAFFLWKCERSDLAKRLLMTCLAWCLTSSEDEETVSTLAGNLQYIYGKEGLTRSEADIRERARKGHF